MFNLKSISIALMCLGAVSCSDSAQDENNRPEEGTTRSSSVAFAAEGDGDLSVFVFNKSDDSFLFHSELNDGWIEQENRKIRFTDLAHGDYKFVFLANRCQNLSLPQALYSRAGGFCFEDMIISHKVLSAKAGFYAGADEIYMQDDNVLANFTHNISGNKVIEANLTRAVGKIDVRLARGYATTDKQENTIRVPVPYTDGKSITELFEGYEIEVIDCGDHLAVDGCTGSASVFEAYAAGDEAVRTIRVDDDDNQDNLSTGFTVLSGPFILPPSGTSNMQVRVKLIPTEDSGIAEFEKILVNGIDGDLNIPRNHKLTITFWLDAQVSPTISVTANIADMDKEVTGDSGMWY